MTWVDDLRAREDACRRAPSAHNTQPWVIRYGADSVDVHWDPARALPDSDPTRRDLFLSLGAYVEASLVVAAGAGLRVRAEIAVDERERRAARLVPAGAVYATPFPAEALQRRRCARGEYEPGPLDPAVVSEVAAGADLRRLDSRPLVRPLEAADRHMFATPAVAAELRQWLRLSPRHPRYALDGLTDRAMELSRAEARGLAAVLSPAAYPLLRRLGAPALLAAASRGLLRYDGSVLVLVGRPDSPAALVEHGRALLRVWLGLSERGFAVHPLSQIIDCEPTAAVLAALVEPAPGQWPLAVFRAGRPRREPVRSSRIPAADAVPG
jgi:hypothetical protein